MAAYTFTATSTWTPGSTETSVLVECFGAGGGGGNGHTVNRGGGGAGGAYASKVVGVTASTVYTVTVGTSAAATIGGDSWFNTSGTVIAKGGNQGGNATVGAQGAGGTHQTANIGDTTFNGGDGFTGSGSSGGGGGGGAGTTAGGTTAASGTGGVYTGVATTGGYATNKTTRSPLLIATNVVFDGVPVHCYLTADDAITGRPSTPIKTTSDSKQFTDAVGVNAVFHETRGRQYAATATTITDTKTISTSTTLNLTSAAAWATSGNGVIEVGASESFIFAYTGKSTNQLTGVTAVAPTSQAVTSGQVAYASALDGHVYPFINVTPTDVVTLVNAFSW